MLPNVSKRAVARVKQPLPVPAQCPYCEGPVAIVRHEDIYHGRTYGPWPFVYRCAPCDAHVGMHPETDIPLGRLATKDLRDSKAREKRFFEQLWKPQGATVYMTRAEAYEWLATAMAMPADGCHWGWFDLAETRMAGMLCREKLQNLKGREA